MHGQCTRLAKTFATFSAFEWLFFRMDESVEEKESKINQIIIEGLERNFLFRYRCVQMCVLCALHAITTRALHLKALPSHDLFC